MARKKSGLKLTFLIYPSEDSPGKYVAHCLELDVVAVGRAEPEAITLLKELITELWKAAAKDGTLDDIINPAPAQFWRQLLHAEPYEPPHEVTKRHIKAPEIDGVTYVRAA